MKTIFSATDHALMARALRLAALGIQTTTPNPRVGCVIAHNGLIVGEGWHKRAGEAHAEKLALVEAGEKARGATAYVTLEPCSHFGRTPPCCDALIASGVSRVVAAMSDPNPLVSGRGFDRLRAHGITVETGLMAAEAAELNLGFVSRMQRGRPWVRLKAAASLDGKTALNNGISQWITSAAARRDGHAWRARACAVLTGIGTVRDDNPRLNVREVDCERQPLKILVDARLEVSPNALLLESGRTIIACAIDDKQKQGRLEDLGIEVLYLPNTSGKVELSALLTALALRGMNEIHVEAGHKLNGSLLRERCADELLMYLAPMLMGNQAQGLFNLPELSSLDEALNLQIIDTRMLGQDIRLRARPIYR